VVAVSISALKLACVQRNLEYFLPLNQLLRIKDGKVPLLNRSVIGEARSTGGALRIGGGSGRCE